MMAVESEGSSSTQCSTPCISDRYDHALGVEGQDRGRTLVDAHEDQ